VPAAARAECTLQDELFGSLNYRTIGPDRLLNCESDNHAIADTIQNSRQARKRDRSDAKGNNDELERSTKRIKTAAPSEVVLSSMFFPPSNHNRQELVRMTDMRNRICAYFGNDYAGAAVRINRQRPNNTRVSQEGIDTSNGKRIQKSASFNHRKYGGERVATFAAEKWRQQTSDVLARTRITIAPFLDLGIEITESTKIFCAWMISGDGNFCVSGASDAYPRCSLGQSCFDGLAPIIFYLMQNLGGQAVRQKTSSANDWRTAYV
jgi:hypothetical protein